MTKNLPSGRFFVAFESDVFAVLRGYNKMLGTSYGKFKKFVLWHQNKTLLKGGFLGSCFVSFAFVAKQTSLRSKYL